MPRDAKRPSSGRIFLSYPHTHILLDHCRICLLGIPYRLRPLQSHPVQLMFYTVFSLRQAVQSEPVIIDDCSQKSYGPIHFCTGSLF